MLDGILRARSIAAVISRFSIVGAVSTGVYFAVANILIASGVAKPTTSSVIAYLVGMVFSFLGQSRITFLLRENNLRQIIRFIFMSAVGLAVSYESVDMAVRLVATPLWGTIATSLAIPILSFLAMKFWVFKSET